MPKSDVEVVVIGAGAAGIAAARRLHEAEIDCLLVEARPRLGGRAFSVDVGTDTWIDLGCGWMHSADRNPWADMAVRKGVPIDKTPPPWGRLSLAIGFPLEDQRDYLKALHAFYQRVEAISAERPDMPAAALLEPGQRWNNLVVATGTYINGVELDRLSAIDLATYEDTGVNWRTVGGYGTLISSCAEGVPVVCDCEVRTLDHSGSRLRLDTSKGAIAADQAIVTLPSAVLAASEHFFSPPLPDKIEAAGHLPLGLADKLFLSLDHAEEFEPETRLFGRTDRVKTGNYHLRPFGRPQIEAYFGGMLARELEAEGAEGFFDFARSELIGLLGGDFARRIKPLAIHCWGRDPFARGSYSYAKPGKAECRRALAAPVDDRLFFAGEACSRTDQSTAHGGWTTGIAAAERVKAARGKIRRV
jgi:monoamine oxidase